MRHSRGFAGLGMIEAVCGLGLKLCAAVVALITAYYIYATVGASNQLFRGMGDAGQPMTVAQFKQHVANMELLMKVLQLAVTIGFFCTLGRYYAFVEAGAAMLVIGGLLAAGMPFLIDTMGGPREGLARALAQAGNPRSYLSSQYQFAGILLGTVGLVHLIVHAGLFVMGMRERRPRPSSEAAQTAAQVRKTSDRFLGKCWELPFCRDTDKKLCPIRQTNRSCWLTGRGCYCDQNVILTISGGGQSGGRVVGGYQSRAAAVVRPKSLSEKREQCMACPVYLHHQGQKYKILAPGVLLGAIGAMVFFWGAYQAAYPAAVHTLGRSLSGFSFGTKAGAVPGWAQEMATNQGVMGMMVIVFALLAIAYLMHAVEWVLYKLGI